MIYRIFIGIFFQTSTESLSGSTEKEMNRTKLLSIFLLKSFIFIASCKLFHVVRKCGADRRAPGKKKICYDDTAIDIVERNSVAELINE